MTVRLTLDDGDPGTLDVYRVTSAYREMSFFSDRYPDGPVQEHYLETMMYDETNRLIYHYRCHLDIVTLDCTPGIPSRLTVWRSGQGVDVPSVWGNLKLTTGQTSVTVNEEQFAPILVHVFSGRGTTQSTPVPNPEQTGLTATNEETTLNNQNVTCTYVAFIATATERGRVATSSC